MHLPTYYYFGFRRVQIMSGNILLYARTMRERGELCIISTSLGRKGMNGYVVIMTSQSCKPRSLGNTDFIAHKLCNYKNNGTHTYLFLCVNSTLHVA